MYDGIIQSTKRNNMLETTEFKQALFDFLEENMRINVSVNERAVGVAHVEVDVEMRNPVNNEFEVITQDSDFISLRP